MNNISSKEIAHLKDSYRLSALAAVNTGKAVKAKWRSLLEAPQAQSRSNLLKAAVEVRHAQNLTSISLSNLAVLENALSASLCPGLPSNNCSPVNHLGLINVRNAHFLLDAAW